MEVYLATSFLQEEFRTCSLVVAGALHQNVMKFCYFIGQEFNAITLADWI
jgi:hypothetical protein